MELCELVTRFGHKAAQEDEERGPVVLELHEQRQSSRLAGPGAMPRRSEVIDREVALRMERQALLTNGDPPQLLVVIDEGALRRVMGGRRVMRAQIEHLLQVAEQPQTQVLVLPFDAGAHAGLNGAFVILDFPPFPEPYPRAVDDRVVYVDTLLGALYLEQPAEVAAYAAAYEQIRAEALSPDQSRETLHKIMKDLTT